MRRAIGPLTLTALIIGSLLLWLGLIPQRAFDTIFVLSLGLSLSGALPRFGMPVLHARLAGLVFATAFLLCAHSFSSVAVTPFLGIALAYALLTYVFGHGLAPNRITVLEQLIRAMDMQSGGSPEFWKFVRGQCLLWSVLGIAMIVLSCVAMFAESHRVVAEQALLTAVIGQLGIFVLSHLYANWRYDRPETWSATLVAMARPGIWSQLKL